VKLLRNMCAAYVVVVCVASIAGAQLPPGSEGKTAEQAYKNIQVLQGTPMDLFLPEMRLFEAALGVDCEYCHSEQDRSKDDLQAKQTARKMIAMVREINKNFDGRTVVTCYTCHRGNVEPVGVTMFPSVERTELNEEEKAKAPAPNYPTVDAILNKYTQAIGGEQAARKITSRMITATQDIPTGAGGRMPVQAQVEIYQKAPNLVLNVYHTDKFTIADGFDGTTSWAQNARGIVNNDSGIDLARAKRNADFYLGLDLKSEYTRLTVTGTEKVNSRDAYVVTGIVRGAGPDRLYFDTQTGLLLRRLTLQPTPFGSTPTEVDYDDYRDDGSGVKLPFVVRMTPGSAGAVLAVSSTIRVQKVQENAPVDDSKFVKPQSKPAITAAPAAPAVRPQ
jgi:photosynthetic reaction center cytochrome c subunit